ncbi:MAG: hypothetical protein NUW01_07065 [Gemmatimonadaceae bacterium]|nr:hypothetical protein [Gemmatimonadaceae bacterium]
MGHIRHHQARDQTVAVLDMPPVPPPSQRARYRRATDTVILKPLEQIRRAPQVVTCAGGYYLDPEGATIRDALHYYPNGAGPEDFGPADQKFAVDYDRHRARQAAKGFKWLGATLNAGAVRELVKTIAANRPDEVKQTEYEIENCEHTIRHSVDATQRAVAQRRYEQFKRRLELLMAPIDADALIAELDAIAKAQRLAKIAPELRAVLMEMMDDSAQKLITQLGTRERVTDPELGISPGPAAKHNPNWTGVSTSGFDGKDFVDVAD